MELETKLHGANWIGLPEHLNEKLNVRKNQIVYYKHIFELNEQASMTIHVSAHNRYKLSINNKRVTTGPCKGDPWCQYYESLDVSAFLQSGKNIITAEVAYYPPNQFLNDRSGGPVSIFTNVFGPYFILKGILLDTSDKVIANISTGVASWYIHQSNAYTWHKYDSTTYTVVGDFETVTSALIPFNWKVSCDYNNFIKANKYWRADGTYFGELLPFTLNKRQIPLLLDKKHEFNREMEIYTEIEKISFKENNMLTLAKNKKYVIELDANELMTGYLHLKTDKGSNSKITITYAESYSKENEGQYPIKGVRDDCCHYQLNGYYDIYYPSGEIFTYEPFWFRTYRFIKIEIEVKDEPLIIYSPYYFETGYPLTVTSNISCNEKWVSDLWDVSIRTLKRCMHETYYDCPYYEQLQYILDTRLEALFTYAITDDTKLIKKAIEEFHASRLPDGQLMCRYPSASRHVMPIFSLQWILMINDYYEQTGDKSLVEKYRPTIESVLAWYEPKIDSYHMLENFGHWHFVDWVEEWENEEGIATGTPNAAKYGPLTYDNLVYIRTLRIASKLMSITNRNDIANEYLKKADIIDNTINSFCYDYEKGLYMDGPQFQEYSQHCQVWAVLSGVAKGQRAKDILIKSLNNPSIAQCSYAGLYFLFRAFEQADLYELTFPLWDKWKNLLPLHLTTWPEDLTRHRSDCHGWGSLPLYEFTRHILGVKHDKAGYESIIIEPDVSSLTHANGQVITPKGIVTIKWEKDKDGLITISGSVPKSIPYKVVIHKKIVIDEKHNHTFNYSE